MVQKFNDLVITPGQWENTPDGQFRLVLAPADAELPQANNPEDTTAEPRHAAPAPDTELAPSADANRPVEVISRIRRASDVGRVAVNSHHAAPERKPAQYNRMLMAVGSAATTAAILLTTYTAYDKLQDQRAVEERVTAESRYPATAPPSLRVWQDAVRDAALDESTEVPVKPSGTDTRTEYKNYLVDPGLPGGKGLAPLTLSYMSLTSGGNPLYNGPEGQGLFPMHAETRKRVAGAINQNIQERGLDIAPVVDTPENADPDTSLRLAAYRLNEIVAEAKTQVKSESEYGQFVIEKLDADAPNEKRGKFSDKYKAFFGKLVNNLMRPDQADKDGLTAENRFAQLKNNPAMATKFVAANDVLVHEGYLKVSDNRPLRKDR